MAKRGRKSTYTQAKADEICQRLSTGETLTDICKDLRIGYRTISAWVSDYPDFGAEYARAKDAGFDAIANDCLRLADNPIIGVKTITKADGSVETIEGDTVERSRLRVDTRKWLLARWDPKRYGDRQQIDHGVAQSLEQLITGSVREREPRKE